MTAVPLPDGPPPELRYRRALRVGPALRELGRSRHIVVGLVVRQVRSQYRDRKSTRLNSSHRT